MKHFDTFSGYGGFSIACERNGIQTIGFSEVNNYANAVLKYHWPKIKNYGDISKITDLPDFDLLTGGSPCQDLSIAGKRRGLSGARSGLFMEYARILRLKKPRYFIWENVKGALSSNYGFDFAVVLNEFSEAGYSLWWQVLNAKDFGVPQNRERIFVIGFRDGSPREIFFERKDGQKHNEMDGQQSQITGTINCGLSKGGNRQDANSNMLIKIIDPYNKSTPQDQQATTTLRTNHSNGNPQLVELTKNQSQGYRVYDPEGISVNIASQAGGLGAKTGLYQIVDKKLKNKSKYNTKDSKPEIGQAMRKYNADGIIPPLNTWSPCLNGSRVRRLTPVECERLMGLPDDWTAKGIMNDKEIKISDNQRYKLCGNGVVVNVVEELIKNLL